jgi:hypothetical protein
MLPEDCSKFLKECEETKENFVKYIVSVPFDVQARTQAENVIIMYDQMLWRIYSDDKK